MKVYKTMDNGVRIVEYDDSMAGAIADMWNKSGDSWGGDSSARTAEQIMADYNGGSYFNVFAALDKNEAVGVCTFSRYYADADTAYVNVLNVRPDYHGKKIGKELVLACVNRTIELGYPRVDIHTWPGNTKAVPLYKKCGFLWEDRADTTHLSNYIPTVLKTELFKEFFKTADWYDDSSRIIEIKPDGVKVNKFELYGYSWTKAGSNPAGVNLAVGFEKTGRRIRYAETDDYKIEFTAENHELAFGLQYGCKFTAENKSGKELKIKIAGKNDGCIKFGYTTEREITIPSGVTEFDAEFYIEPITEEIDVSRMHPCVLADVYVNGLRAEFGLGIEPKFPVSVSFIEERQLARPGMIEDVYINVKSALLKKAGVKFTIPENGMTRFYDGQLSVDLNPGEISVIPLKAEILKCGYEKADINYTIAFDDGGGINFSKPLRLINHGIGGAFHYETEHEYAAVSGLYKLTLYKRGGYAYFSKAAGHGGAGFNVPKLGKPYSDEFDLIKPSDVMINDAASATVFEADYESAAFSGVLLTVIIEFNASGIIYRRIRVSNRSQRTVPLYLHDQYWSTVGRRSVFHYDGGIQEISDNTVYGFSDLHSEKIDENWIFDDSGHNKSGVYWDKEYKPHTKWGDSLVFEHDIGALKPGETFETKPSVYMSGVFCNFNEFRNYVLGVNEKIQPYTTAPLDISVNARNPFITADTDVIKAVIKNHRLKIYGGEITFSSPDGLFNETSQTNPDKEISEINSFDAPVNENKKTPGVYLTELALKFKGWEKTRGYALFSSDKSVPVGMTEKDGVYGVTNGKLCFKAAPDYSDALYSMTYGGAEWLFSLYPDMVPYSWMNPFIGGIQSVLWSMSNNLVVREKKTAEFVTVKDSFGSEWTGIKTTVSVNEFYEHKGIVYEQFYVTQPSLPVLCCFIRLINNTGGYKNIGYNMNAYLSGRENLTDIYARVTTNEKDEYRLRMGEGWHDADRLVRISREGSSAREEKLYVYTDARRNNGSIGIGGDVNSCNIYCSAWTNLLKDASHTMRPVFFILTEKELTLDSLADLERVTF